MSKIKTLNVDAGHKASLDEFLRNYPEMIAEDISFATVNYLLQGSAGGLNHEVTVDLLKAMLTEVGYDVDDVGALCCLFNDEHTFYGVNLVSAIQAGICEDPNLFDVYKLVEVSPIAEVVLKGGTVDDARAYVFGWGDHVGDDGYEDLDPDFFVDEFEHLLSVSRVYRSASSHIKDEASKFCQNSYFGEDYVGFKFDVPIFGDVVFLGSGDEHGTSHIPIIQSGFKVRCVDPRNPSVYRKHPDHSLPDLATCGCRADLDYDEDYVFSDMSNPNDDMTGVGSLRRFEKYYQHYFDSGKQLAFKWDITADIGFPVSLWKKPRPHNKEVILLANFPAGVGLEYNPRQLIVEAIKANWSRNRAIKEGRYQLPMLDSWVIDKLSDFGRLTVDPRPTLVRTFHNHTRFPIRKSAWIYRLAQADRPVSFLS